MQPIKIKQQISTNRKELVDTLYLMMLQGINQLLPIFVMPYLMIKLYVPQVMVMLDLLCLLYNT